MMGKSVPSYLPYRLSEAPKSIRSTQIPPHRSSFSPMPSLYAEIDINAPQSVVWEALLRKDQWRYWNTFLYDCDPGLRITRGGEIFLAMQRLEGDEETEFQAADYNGAPALYDALGLDYSRNA